MLNALAVSEENASGGTIVTAPTCGSCGVMPGVLYHLAKAHQFSERKILRALATAGLFGNVVKANASISGAEVGCQGGSRCSLRYGVCSRLPAIWWNAVANRVCSRNGVRTSLGNDLRPCLRISADTMYRT